MNLLIKQDQKEWVLNASNWLTQKTNQYNAKSMYIPAGETPKLLYKDWEQRKPSEVEKLRLLQIDEVLTGDKKDIFKDFFYSELPTYANKIELISDGSTQADLAILGLGLNGHVAFHEPGIHNSFYSGCVKLQNETIQNLQLEPITWGQTYGAQAFYNCKAILVIVRGEKKKQILQNSILQKNAGQIPAAALMDHPDITILTDFEV